MNDKRQVARVNLSGKARLHSDKALETLVRLLDDPDPKVQIAAIKELFDRAYGKASQPIEGDKDNPLMIVQKIVSGDETL